MNERTNETRRPMGGRVGRCIHLVGWRVLEKAMNDRGDDLKNMVWSQYGSVSKHRRRLSATPAILFKAIRFINSTTELPHDYFVFSHKYPNTVVK